MPQMPNNMPQPNAPQPNVMQDVKQNMSIFNPVDAAAMKESGQFSSNMSIRDFFAQQGVDVDGPVTQLLQFAKDQAKKASPLGKMQAIAGQGAPPAGQQAGQAPSEPPPELGGLLQKLRG